MSTTQHRIAVVGSLNIDLVTRVTRMPDPGETLQTRSFSTGFGGKGANQAVACARLSRRRNCASPSEAACAVRMVGAVGHDSFGSDMIAALQSDGVDVSGVKVVPARRTGTAVIIVEEASGENRILFSQGANHEWAWGDEHARLADPLPSLVVLQLEIPLRLVLEVMREARSRGVEVLLNPAPAVPLPHECFVGVTHLIMNESEAAILSGCSGTELEKRGLEWVADEFIEKGVGHVVLTLGARGAFYKSGGMRKGALVSGRKVDVVDTTAAGDTFVGAYATVAAASDSTTFSIAEAVDWANRAASLTVQRHGAQAAIPWLDEVADHT